MIMDSVIDFYIEKWINLLPDYFKPSIDYFLSRYTVENTGDNSYRIEKKRELRTVNGLTVCYY